MCGSVSGEGTGGGDGLAEPSITPTMVRVKLLLALFLISWEGKGDYFLTIRKQGMRAMAGGAEPDTWPQFFHPSFLLRAALFCPLSCTIILMTLGARQGGD